MFLPGFIRSESDREGMPEPALRVREAFAEKAETAGDGCEGSNGCQSDRVRG